MTHHDRILAALRRQPVDRLPWVPRLDLWYNANRYCGTLPPQWADASLMEIVVDLGVGFHAVIPDFLDTEEPDESYDRALGLDHVKNQPFRLRFRRTERTVEHHGDEARVSYHTPAGSLSAKIRYTEQMRRDGATLMQATERVVKCEDDYRIVAALFEDIEVTPDEGRYLEFAGEVGDSGLAVAYANVAASPLHHLLKELVPYDQFYYHLHDRPQMVEGAARALEAYFGQILDACAASSAEAVMFGANYDVALTPPSIFEPHILPELSRWAARIEAEGKLLVTHTDGENDGLCELYAQAGIHVADSVCPTPMTRLSLQAHRDLLGPKIAIWGGICSVSVLTQSMTDHQFQAHIDEALAAAGDGVGIVFSIADTTPPQASLARIRYIGERSASFTPVA